MQSPRTASPPQPHRFDNTNDHEPAEPSTFGISSKAPHVQVDAAASRGVSAPGEPEKSTHIHRRGDGSSPATLSGVVSRLRVRWVIS